MRPAEIEAAVVAIIEQTREKAGLSPVKKPKAGRPLKHQHPLPRRSRMAWEQLDSGTHKRTHQNVYVETCEYCYAREYAYFRHHPDRARTEPRPWIDPGWVEHKAKKRAVAHEQNEKRRFIRTRGRG